MNHCILSEHIRCKEKTILLGKKEWSVISEDRPSRICELNPKHFIFYLYGQFHIVTYNSCFRGYEPEPDFNKWIIQQCCINSKISTKSIDKSEEFNSSFREAAMIGISLKHTVTEINYLYSNAAGKEYAIVTRLPFCEALVNEDTLYDRYFEAKQYIGENLHSPLYHINKLEELYHKNKAYKKNKSITVVNTIDLLIKQINKK